MGASSTRYITREDALKVLIPKLMTMSNEELEEILDKAWDRSLLNFSIIVVFVPFLTTTGICLRYPNKQPTS